jgi:DNA-binding MarR family transcriptional regulator
MATRESSVAAEAWKLMFELFQSTKPERMAMLAEFGLAPMQAMLLDRLEPGDPQPMSALAGVLHCDNSSVTHIVDRLEALALVERRPAPHDRRVKHVALTAEGASVRAEVQRTMSRPPGPLAALAPADQLALRDILARALAG